MEVEKENIKDGNKRLSVFVLVLGKMVGARRVTLKMMLIHVKWSIEPSGKEQINNKITRDGG